MKAKSALIAFLSFLFCFSFARSVLAVTVTITNFPSSISSDSFTVNVSILGASSGTNYIRVDLYKDGTSNYFSETYNGSDWYSGSDGKQYFPIIILDSKSTASASLQARIGVPSSSDYDGQGSYKMRIRRYTNSGGQGSEDPNNSAVNVSINLPTSTLTPTPVLTISPTPSLKPTSTLIPTPTKTPTPTSKPSLTLTPSNVVLGETTKSALPTKQEERSDVKIESLNSKPDNLIAKIFIFLGVIFLLACAIVIAYPFIVRFKREKLDG